METTRLLGDDENHHGNTEQSGYILGTDFGSTYLTVKVYDGKARLVASSSVKVPYLDVAAGGVEIDPIKLYELYVQTVKELLSKKDIEPSNIRSSGFSCQRGTFLLWNRDDGKPRCNLISWQDTRCARVVKECNNDWKKRLINVIGSIAYLFFKSRMVLLMKVLKFDVAHASMKLVWLLKNDPQLNADVQNNKVLFGTVDTWMVWKLTNGGKHVTDFSCASGTALYDPYKLEWSGIMQALFGISPNIFPTVVNTSGVIATTAKDIFGAPIPINAIVADSQAGVFGLNCYDVGQASCIMGTGCFFSINTGSYAHASIAGLYPQIGWKCDEDLTYACEGNIKGTAASIEWAKQIGLFEDVSLMSDIAKSVIDTDGVFFIPAFSGLAAPHNDPTACTGLIGVKRSTGKAHIVRAILEGIAFRFFELYRVALDETKMPFVSPIKVSGGLTKNDFLMELISSLTNCDVEKADDSDISLTGAVYLAGLGAGIWKDKEEISRFPKCTQTFHPDITLGEKYAHVYEQWLRAVDRCRYWYTE